MSLSPSGRARMRVCVVAVLACMGVSSAATAQCPSVIRVPQDAPSINAAVAQVCANTTAEIVVGPGTWSAYVQPPAGSSVVVRGADRALTTITPTGPNGRFTGISSTTVPERIRFVDAKLQGPGGGDYEWRVSFTRCDVVGCANSFFPEGESVEDTRFIDCASGNGVWGTLYMQKRGDVLRCQFIRCPRPLTAWGGQGSTKDLIQDCEFVDCQGPVQARAPTRLERGTFRDTGDVSRRAILVQIEAQGSAADPSFEVVGCTFTGIGLAGGVPGGAIRIEGDCSATIANSTFTGCRGTDGGAISVDNCDLFVSGCAFSENTAQYGGALHGTFARFEITDSTFNANIATASFFGAGGAIEVVLGTAVIEDSSFVGNRAPNGSGGAISGNNLNPKYLNDMPFRISGCSFEGNHAAWYGGAVFVRLANTGGIGIHSSDFGGSTALEGNDVTLDSVDYEIAMSGCTVRASSSPVSLKVISTSQSHRGLRVSGSTICGVSATPFGSQVFDAGGNCVVQSCADSDNNGVPDACQCRGDITGNGVIDGIDLAIILSAWGSTRPTEFDADIDNDGIVGGTDLAFVLSGWGPCPQ
jgi:hypothetical protein